MILTPAEELFSTIGMISIDQKPPRESHKVPPPTSTSSNEAFRAGQEGAGVLLTAHYRFLGPLSLCKLKGEVALRALSLSYFLVCLFSLNSIY